MLGIAKLLKNDRFVQYCVALQSHQHQIILRDPHMVGKEIQKTNGVTIIKSDPGSAATVSLEIQRNHQALKMTQISCNLKRKLICS